MRGSSWTPSIVPNSDQTVYLVVDDLGRKPGRIWREAGVEHTDLETVIQDLLEGQYQSPIGAFAFNAAEAGRMTFRPSSPASYGGGTICGCAEIPDSIADFVDRHEERDRHQLTLRLL